MAANDRQVGGRHYRKIPGEQHWDRIWRLYGPGYFIGNITKYVERYQDKNGIEDLNKARHYIDKLIELETARLTASPSEPTTAAADVPPGYVDDKNRCVPGLSTALHPSHWFVSGRCDKCGWGVWTKEAASECTGSLVGQMTQPLHSNDQPAACCECGGEYPKADLIEGNHIYCPTCRELYDEKTEQRKDAKYTGYVPHPSHTFGDGQCVHCGCEMVSDSANRVCGGAVTDV